MWHIHVFVTSVLFDVGAAWVRNGVVGDPQVDCGVDGIAVNVQTQHPFQGRLYVQPLEMKKSAEMTRKSSTNGKHSTKNGEVEDSNCVSTFHDTVHTRRNAADGLQFALKFGECNMQRQRTLNPRGVVYSFNLVVSFHPMFITEVDRAYRIRCFFVESAKAIEAALEVGRLNTLTLDQQFVLPQCNYQLRESRDGPFVRFAHVGDHVTHVWHCDNVAGFVYGMLIHSCYVDDGHGDRVQLINNHGCVADPLLVSDVEYENDVVTAFADTHVFKYADKIQLFFTCTVQLCFKNDGGCDNVTPPSCAPSGNDAPDGFPSLDNFPATFAVDLSAANKAPSKQFFGPIEADERIAKGVPPVFAHEMVEPNLSHLKDSPLNDSESEPASVVHKTRRVVRSASYSVAETDVSARVLVMPLAEATAHQHRDPRTECTDKGRLLVVASAAAMATCLAVLLALRCPLC